MCFFAEENYTGGAVLSSSFETPKCILISSIVANWEAQPVTMRLVAEER